MTRTLKGIGALIVGFVIIGAAFNYFGLPKSSTASTRHHAATISPEELTRIADPSNARSSHRELSVMLSSCPVVLAAG